MSITESSNSGRYADFHDHGLLKMFGTFCCKVFEYRESLISPVKKMEIEMAGAGLYSVEADDTSAVAAQSPAGESAVVEAEGIAKEVAFQQERSNVIHRSISLYIKSIMENTQNSPLYRSTMEVIYAMAAIADEIFLNMDWKGKRFWEEHMLEQVFFNSQVAGDEIFRRIDNVMEEKEAIGIEKAEIYLNMLLLGFKGKFRGASKEINEISFYKRKLFNFITRENKEEIVEAEHRLFQKEYSFTMPTIRRKLLPDAGIVTYMAACFLLIFLTVSTIVWLWETLELSRLLNDISGMILREC